jgi:hypothetical protein
MNKILIAAALALVASSPLAFAAKTATPSASIMTTEHCSSVEQNFDNSRSHYKSESAFLTAEQKAMSLCRQDKHKNGGSEARGHGFGGRFS